MRLPGWCERGDAYFDLTGFVMLIEKAIHLQFLDSELERLPNLDSDDDLTVQRFVIGVVELCSEKVNRYGEDLPSH